jgi:ABC-type Fe3+/spermidine/putrescine transport system ATPase subunit
MPDVALKIEHLSKSFGRFKAVDDLALEVYQGEVFTLLGPSGCGKTTTLRLVAGLEEAEDGVIYLGGEQIVGARAGIAVPIHKRNLGMVFQSYAIWPHMTVFENVAYPLKVRGIRGEEQRRRVRALLELVGLAAFENRPAPKLSGGQQQRVALARALVHEPRLLLLDEPFSNLDAKLREQMRVQLKLLLKQLGITALFVTHDQVEALSLSSRLAVMNAGRVEQVGTPKELYEAPTTPFVRDFLGRTVLLRGVVGEVDGDICCVRLDAGGEVRLRARRQGDQAHGPGAHVVVALRPEDIQVSPLSEDGRSGWPLVGTIETLLFVGDRYECGIALGDGGAIVAHAPRSTGLYEGQRVALTPTEEQVSVWPVQG